MEAKKLFSASKEPIRLSVPYLQFHDKRKKALKFLHTVEKISIHDLDMSTFEHWYLFKDVVPDGGCWTAFVHLVDTVGVVPYQFFGTNYQSKNTHGLNTILESMLKEWAFHMMGIDAKEERRKVVKLAIADVERVLVCCFSAPPSRITLEKSEFGFEWQGTPLAFADFFQTRKEVCFGHAPHLNVGSVYYVTSVNDEKRKYQVRFVSVTMDQLWKGAVSALKSKRPVWFSADVRSMLDKDSGTMDPCIYDFKTLFQTSAHGRWSKRSRCVTHATSPNHAMLLTGVTLSGKGVPTKWRVQNSWGEQGPGKGFYTMSQAWFRENVFEVALLKADMGVEIPSKEEIIGEHDIFHTLAAVSGSC
jgi:bleomycin hydrolase